VDKHPGAVVITGGAQGIGRSVGHHVAAAGYPVALVDIQESVHDTAKELAEATGSEVRGYRSDVTNAADVDASVEGIRQDFSTIYGLVNNAGIITRSYALAEDVPEDEFDAMMATHVKGAFLYSSRAIRVMKEQRSGRILMISSVVGPQGFARRLPYSTAKTAVLGMMRSLVVEGGPSRVTVNSINPGYILTDAIARRVESGNIDPEPLLERVPLGRWGSPDDVGRVIASMLSPAFDYVSGTEVTVDGGYRTMGDFRSGRED
jgi:NAD(P)-dependent dehydrogenase (short-subunit alcohol dehydrogenase family)